MRILEVRHLPVLDANGKHVSLSLKDGKDH
jgi:hypothetical protein